MTSTAAPPAAPFTVSYPLWFPGIVPLLQLGSGFGALQPYWDKLVAFWHLCRMCWGCTPQQLHQLRDTAYVLKHPVYQTARVAVQQTARKPGMRDHHYWHEIARVAKAWQWSENIFRRLDANETADRLLRAGGSTVNHMTRELAVELAYREYKAREH